MGPIEWLLVFEGIVLLVAAICGSTAYFSRPTNQDPDAFLRAMLGFWRTVGARRLVLDPVGHMRVAETEDDEEVFEESTRPTTRREPAGKISGKAAFALTTPESPVLRGGVAPGAVATCSFGITVVPRSATNNILGCDESGLRVAVNGAADDAVANKLVLAIVAREFDVRPYQVTLTRGHFSVSKAVRIAGVSQDEADRVMRKFPAV